MPRKPTKIEDYSADPKRRKSKRAASLWAPTLAFVAALGGGMAITHPELFKWPKPAPTPTGTPPPDTHPETTNRGEAPKTPPTQSPASPPDTMAPTSTKFSICGGFHYDNCVVDGDTFHFEGEKIRVVGIDTPETHPPRCESEAALGEQATKRLQEILNEGPFQLVASADRDRDRYGRLLRAVMRNGERVTDRLVR